MTERQLTDHIITNPDIMVGNPVIKGTRLTVDYTTGLLAQGTTFDEIMQEYPGITAEDIQAYLTFTAQSKKPE